MNGKPEAPRDESPGNSREGAALKSVVEALLFASDEPLSIERIRSVVPEASARQIRGAMEELNREYISSGHAFTIEEVAGGYRMYTRPEFQRYLRDFFRQRAQARLTIAALETLAIIAYRQPVERAVIEDIRGVNSEGVIKNLMERGLVKIVGRSSKLGHPLLYGTTKRFLEHFGLKSIKDLPKVDELARP